MAVSGDDGFTALASPRRATGPATPRPSRVAAWPAGPQRRRRGNHHASSQHRSELRRLVLLDALQAGKLGLLLAAVAREPAVDGAEWGDYAGHVFFLPNGRFGFAHMAFAASD